MHYDAVIFDRDNTLVYVDQPALAQFERALQELVPSLRVRELIRVWETWTGDWPQHIDQEPAFWRAFWLEATAAESLEPQALDALCLLGTRYASCMRAFPDAAQTIATLRNSGVKLGVLTNFELPSVASALEESGLAPDWFHAIASARDLGARKPQRAAYERMAALLEAAPSACLLVDDHPANVVGALAAGMPAVLLDRAYDGPARADVVASLREIVALVRGRHVLAATGPA